MDDAGGGTEHLSMRVLHSRSTDDEDIEIDSATDPLLGADADGDSDGGSGDASSSRPVFSFSDLDELTWLRAVASTRDAWEGKRYAYKSDAASIRGYLSFNRGIWKALFLVAVVGSLALVLFEKPTYDGWEMPVWLTTSVELIFLSILMTRTVMLKQFIEPANYWRDPKIFSMYLIILVTVIDIGLYAIVTTYTDLAWVRATRILRPAFVICCHRHVRRATRNLRQCLYDLFTLLSFLAAVIVVTALLFFVLFRNSQQGLKYFSNIPNTVFELYVLMTADNFPPMMMPAYDINAFYAVLFIFYNIVCTYFLLNIALAMIYRNYRKHLTAELNLLVEQRKASLQTAFSLLQVNGMISRDRWIALFSRVHPKGKSHATLLFKVIDETNREAVGLDAFVKTIELLNLKIVEIKNVPLDKSKLLDRIYISRASVIFRSLVQHKLFVLCFDLIVLLNILLLVFGIEVEVAFIVVYWIEIASKVYTYGPHLYLRSQWNRFDLLTMTLAVVLFILDRFLSLSENWHSFVMCLRVLRLFKLLLNIKRYDLLVRTMRKLLPPLSIYITVLFLLYYSMAIIGMELYAHSIDEDDPRLEDTPYAEGEFFNLNFDNVTNSMIVLFAMMLMATWSDIVTGFVAVTSKWSRLYFTAFNLMSVVLIVNVIIAFILEGFMYQYSIMEDPPTPYAVNRLKTLGLDLLDVNNPRMDHTRRKWYVVNHKATSTGFLESVFGKELRRTQQAKKDGHVEGQKDDHVDE